MRRLLLVFMMVLLPLQWSWAAAAGVCEHESGAAHFGHHEHQHVGQPDGDAGSDDTQPAGKHLDCQVCHGVGAACVAVLEEGQPAWCNSPPPSAYSRHLPDPPVERFLRPPLTLVA